MDEGKKKIQAEVLEKKEEIEEIVSKVAVKEKEEEDISEKEGVKYEFKQSKHKVNKKCKISTIIITVIVSFIVLLILCTGFAILNLSNNKILKGISIRNISVEGLTKEEAITMLTEKLNAEKIREISIKVDSEEYFLTPEQIGVEYSVQQAIEEAYNIGRSGNIIQNNFAIFNTFINDNNIGLEFSYDEKLLKDKINEININIPDAISENSYCIEDNILIITRGTSGRKVNEEAAKNIILQQIDKGLDEVKLDTEYAECPKIDIEKIYNEVHSEPQNATYTKEPFQIIPHKNGLDFDIEAAKKLLEEEKEEYQIKLTITEPEILTNEIGEEAFPDLLGSYSTKFDVTNYSRASNVRLALQKLNGIVVMPGEVFSYNKTLGKRTVEAGYKNAAGYSGGKVVPMLGGGICQVSSTLYDAVVYANLNIVERHNHMFQTQYIGAGRDATVVYGSLDFKFENTRKYPIMIKTKSSGGVADIKIFGIREEVEYQIEIVPTILSYTSYKVVYEDDASLAPGKEKVEQSGMKGCKTITYKITKLNGQEISREALSTDTYRPLNKIVRRGVATQPTVTEQESTPVQQPEDSLVQQPEIKPDNTPVQQPEDANIQKPEEAPSIPTNDNQLEKPSDTTTNSSESKPDNKQEETPDTVVENS